MSTTTIRMSEDLRQRVRLAADRAGTTTHGFILQAIAEKAEMETLQHEVQEEAKQRYAAIVASGETIPWAAMRQHLERSLQAERGSPPKARKLTP